MATENRWRARKTHAELSKLGGPQRAVALFGTDASHFPATYMLAKIERHQDLRITLTDRERPHPVLTAARYYLRLRRAGRLPRLQGAS
jgi:hypothetical protein